MEKPSKPTFNETFSYKLIYIYTIDDERHKGLLKIGDTSISSKLIPDPEQVQPNSKLLNQAARKRINHQTNTAAVVPRLIHTELAIRYVVSSQNRRIPELFRDYQIHEVLKNSNYKPYKWKGCRSKEWFEIDLQTALQAIDAYKKGFSNLSHAPSSEIRIPVSFRPEQEKAISQTVKRFQTGDRFLWNAKMRFGKTLCALEVVRRMGFGKTIIITHRPVVDDGWYTDFGKIFIRKEDSNWIYGSKKHGNSLKQLRSHDGPFVYFASIQDLRGSARVGGNFDKNNDVFRLDWDCVIIDESHEGTTTELGEKVREALVKKKRGCIPKQLELSGTPFNRIPDFEEQETYTWDYVMEQRAKAEWDENHEDDSNPYADLPEMQIYTYDLGDLVRSSQYFELIDKAFNFAEFFRIEPETVSFVHEDDIKHFLDLISTESDSSNYPFATEESRDLFRHTLWMVPGVKEARALKELMLAHPVFGCGSFQIINVAGNGDEEVRPDKALEAVREGIENAGEDGYTITLSCGRLTTGVTVREWTAVMMLSGTASTSAASYLQTIFRVQSPCSSFGRMKERCYVFDFAPDRTLRMISEAVRVSAKPGKTTDGARRQLGEFLNFCPVISINGTQMARYDTPRFLQELKRVYVEKVIMDGFDTESLYSDKLMQLTGEALKYFEKLKGIIGTSKAAPRTGELDINNQGFDEEEYEEAQDLEKKKRQRKPLSKEEKERLKQLNEQKKQKQKAISILRGISIRMPLLIYGANIPISTEITLRGFVDMIDPVSWEEFMPQGVTKELFMKFLQYYDEDIFVAAGKRIRETVKKADSLPPLERIEIITRLFSHFKNPDKETVLTPWRVVNMHLGDTLGGWCFYDEERQLLPAPRWVSRGNVTEQTFGNPIAKILEINSKTGLYPLYAAYSLFRARYSPGCLEHDVWLETVRNNIFVICKTPMAAHITRRTLIGYQDGTVNARYFNDLVRVLREEPELFKNEVMQGVHWGLKGVKEMKFDAIVGNPPYQVNDGGNGASATPIYQYFITQSKGLSPRYISMIMPSRWFAGGKGLDDFRDSMIKDKNIRELHDYLNAVDCFGYGVEIKAGVCYFLWDRDNEGPCRVNTYSHSGLISSKERYMQIGNNDVFIRRNESVPILEKVQAEDFSPFSELVSARKPFGLPTNFTGRKKPKSGDIILYQRGGTGYASPSDLIRGHEWVNMFKVYISEAYNAGDEWPHQIINQPFVGKKGTACTETYLLIGPFQTAKICANVISYMKTKFFRHLLSLRKISQHATQNVYSFVPIQDFSKPWTDEELYKKYRLNKEEIAFIESMIKPMD